MDLRQIEVFLAVMENATVTQTAERLHVSPGAITLQLQGLARELRAELFVRSGRRIVPTPQAHRFAEHAREVMKKIREIEQDFVDSHGCNERRGRIQFPNDPGRHLRGCCEQARFRDIRAA